MKTKFWACLLAVALLLCSCGNVHGDNSSTVDTESSVDEVATEETADDIPTIAGLQYQETVALEYATEFQIYRYREGYSLIAVSDGRQYLVVPEGKNVPEDLPEDMIILQQPLTNIYMAASASMSLVNAIDALDLVRLSSLTAEGWYVEPVKAAMDAGRILFAGKYSQPDYELLLQEQCSLAVENTMILHVPEVQEKLEETGIPVFIDRSSYEEHPLGRTEWIKVYGELTGKREAAENYFLQQAAYVEDIQKDSDSSGDGKKTVVFFYINEAGGIVTRKTNDYVPKMIGLAGGEYIFSNLGTEDASATTSVNMTMDEFYAGAKDADVLIYNGTIDNALQSVDELLDKNALFADFKSVQQGQVWCCNKYMYQATDQVGSITMELHLLLTEENATGLEFFYRVE